MAQGHRCSIATVERRTELELTRRSVVCVPPGQLAMRREAALQVIEELIDALQRLDAIRRELDRERGP